MPDEAKLADRGHGLTPETDGWFIVNVGEAQWWESPRFGRVCPFNARDRMFPEIGINIHVLEPGQPACLYHREGKQENFLILSGECLLLVEGQERRLKTWDFVHCPPGTTHVFVGAGEGPCAILMVGARGSDPDLTYPVSDLARRHGASAQQETHEPQEAYAGSPEWQPTPGRWPL